jgi:predicted HTH domain antitoxin
MVKTNGKFRSVQVELPDEAFESYPWDPDRIASQLRLLWLLEQVRERRIGHGKAAELAGLGRAQFLEIMGKHRMTAFDYDVDELDEEFR